MRKNEEIKDDLFLKVSIENIHGGIVAELGLREYAVLQVIASHADKYGKCFPSQEKLAELCGVSKRTIIRLIDNICAFKVDGKPVLIRETKREGEKITKNYYTVLPLSGMVFGDSKVVSNLSPRQNRNVKSASQCEKDFKGSDKTGKEVVAKLAKGSDKNVTLTKSINEININKNHIEQDISTPSGDHLDFDNTNLVEEKDNKDNINIDLKTNKLPEYKGDKINDNTAITPNDIVANNTEKNTDKNDIKDTGQGVDTAARSNGLSLSEIAALISEENQRAREREQAKKSEEKAVKKGLKEHEIVAFRTQYSPDMASQNSPKGESHEGQKISLESKNKADNDEFIALLNEVEAEYKELSL
ncbi:helix-turn-helix domain-containing protein [Sutcliffiella horikoshii]|uniref:Helix-turn-helix domain-containing protein n=1 Tax=Sutcliffiella horikoshii TaxID=79883 RepID=A0A5D4SZL4_9BACI|nr:helix-turn-helix domain-containing protein [Sutcliffiella horikoshii]TYS68837.1 helix-turn-helix domain-containing protein [Sutcliffiella horikoshii]